MGFALLAPLAGCTPPYPIHRRTVGTHGPVADFPDVRTIQPGKSRRDDVLTAFKGIDTGIPVPWLFWGRWKSSSAALRALTDAGFEQIPIWKANNLLVEFDDGGVVKHSATIPDEHVVPELERILSVHTASATQSAAPLTVPATLHPSDGHWCKGTITLSADKFEFSNLAGRGCPSKLILPRQILTIGPFAAPVGEFNPGPVADIRVKLRFADTTPFGHETNASLKTGDLFSLLRVLYASKSTRP
ncbi:MAG TPA: hypothetical protein VLW54_06210 [Candidatus Acidoferrales bacterium]|nr:hypothetical protein [Candidatus Acidoferrales bacterium]